jgi:hypothetical protein
MSRLGKLRPARREIIVSLVIFGGVALLLLFSSFSQFGLSPQYAGTTFSPSLTPGASSTGSFFGGVAGSQNLPTSGNGRVVNTTESLIGELRHGRFEPVTGQIISNLGSIGGYVESSNLIYNGTAWFGTYSVNLPSQDSTTFLFNVTNIVNENGKTTSVQIETQDVTNKTGGNQSNVPYSSFAITLQEEANTTNIQTTNQVSGTLSSIGSVLSIVLSGAAYVFLVAIPVYLIILGAVLLSGRVLYPMFQKVSKSSEPRKQNQPPALRN